MLARANVGVAFDDLLSHRATSGVEKELQTHLGLAGNQIPFDMIRGGDMEQRAVTSGATNVGQEQHPIIPYIFPQSASAFLGVSMPTVPVGEAVFSVLTGTLDVHTPAENAAAAETTVSFSSTVLTPTLIPLEALSMSADTPSDATTLRARNISGLPLSRERRMGAVEFRNFLRLAPT